MTLTNKIIFIGILAITVCNLTVFLLLQEGVYMETLSWRWAFAVYLVLTIAVILSFIFLNKLYCRGNIETGIRSHITIPLIEHIGKFRKNVIDETTRWGKDDFGIFCLCLKESVVYIMDATGIITGWNDEAEKLYGYRRREVVGSSSSILHSETDKQTPLLIHNRTMAVRHGAHRSEGWRIKKNGLRFMVNSFVIRLVNVKTRLSGFLEFTLNEQVAVSIENPDSTRVKYLSDAFSFLSRTDVAGCVLRWGRGKSAYFEQTSVNDDRTGQPLSIEIMASATPGVSESLRKIFERQSWQPAMNRLVVKGFHFSELFRKTLVSTEMEEIDVIIFKVRYGNR